MSRRKIGAFACAIVAAGLSVGLFTGGAAAIPTTNLCGEGGDELVPVTVDTSALWPPNHKLVNVTLSWNLPDPGENEVNSLNVTSVTSNEGTNVFEPDYVIGATTDGNTEGVPATAQVQLRAERDGSGGGRVYTITGTCDNDGEGPYGPWTVTVTVPHDQR